LFVPPNQPVDRLLDVLRANKDQLIVVVNEFGGLLGIFTLEDILEELVGDIYDDQEAPPRDEQVLLMKPDGSELVVDGTTELRIMEAHFEQDLAGKPYDSVNLWIIRSLERIPAPGESFQIEGLEVKIERASRRRIHEVRIRRPSARVAAAPKPRRPSASQAGRRTATLRQPIGTRKSRPRALPRPPAPASLALQNRRRQHRPRHPLGKVVDPLLLLDESISIV
jgi:hypothetical protein